MEKALIILDDAVKIKEPKYLFLREGENISYGYNQEWYESRIRKMSGCGPTAATTILIYLNNDNKLKLPYKNNERVEIIKAMNDVWNFVTPSFMGLHKTSLFKTGIDRFSKHYNLNLKCKILDIKSSKLKRQPLEEVSDFIKKGLNIDSPVAFLNLHAGELKVLEHWHWIVIIGIKRKNNKDYIICLDQGNVLELDLKLWIETTKKGGGFAYIENN